MKKILATLLIASLCVCAVFAQGAKEALATPATSSAATPKQADKTLVVGVQADFEEKWNPFMAESAYDQQVIEQIFTGPTRASADNEMIPFAGNISSELTADGGVLYTVTCDKGMVFSDGEPVTIDDWLYSIYVCADPSYTGPSAGIVTEDIEGMKEYYYDNPNYSAVAKVVAEKYTVDTISLEDYIEYMKEELWATWSPNPVPEADPWGVTWDVYLIEYCGISQAEVDAAKAAGMDAYYELLCKAEVESCWYDYDPSAYWTTKVNDSMKVPGQKVETITGIKKIDDYTATVKYNSINIYGDRSISFYFVPEHYYGSVVKGDVSSIISNMVPMGSGPYKWVGYSDKIVTCEANTLYFEGVPAIGTVKWQKVSETDVLAALANGDIDIAQPNATQQNLDEMDALGIVYNMMPVAGYGYCGFNSENLPLYVRKGLWCLMSNRQPTVTGYYGKIARVIERPMTTVLGEYPQEATQYYPYSKEEALKYFEMAGYTQKNGVLVNADGEKLVVNGYIGGDGIGDHPTYAMFVQTAEDLKSLGGEFQILDVPFNVLQAAMNDGTADIFVLAWGNVTTCDKTSQFHSLGGQNRYRIKDAKMDALLEKIVVTVDFEERKALVAEMLDLAMDLCLELPVYQRNDIMAYNPNAINSKTWPERTTSFWDYSDELWKLEMN